MQLENKFNAHATAGDINNTEISLANNVTTPTNVAGLAFVQDTTKSFSVDIMVNIDATNNKNENFNIRGFFQTVNGTWDYIISSYGQNSEVEFTVTASGQIQYTSGNYTGFVSATATVRAFTLD